TGLCGGWPVTAIPTATVVANWQGYFLTGPKRVDHVRVPATSGQLERSNSAKRTQRGNSPVVTPHGFCYTHVVMPQAR
ncbi:MAG: hypothetical protein ACRD9L_09045, partial [Bryobacteraceae bacterium]